MLSFSLSAYMIIHSTLDYLKFEVTTSTRHYSEYPLAFPDISICNTDLFITNYSIRYLANFLRNNKDRFNDSKLENQTYTDDLALVNYFIKNDDNKEFYIFSRDKISLENSSVREKIGYSYNEMFLSCKFQRENCKETDFIQHYHYIYGNCFIFNNLPRKKAMLSLGIDQSLDMELLVGKPKTYLKFFKSIGANLYIFNQSAGASIYDKYEVSVGSTSKIGIKKTFVNKLPDPYSDCDTSDTISSSSSKDRLQ